MPPKNKNKIIKKQVSIVKQEYVDRMNRVQAYFKKKRERKLQINTESSSIDSNQLQTFQQEEINSLYCVQKIKDRRLIKGRYEYLIEWKGYPGKDTWENMQNLSYIEQIVNEFNQSYQKRLNTSQPLPNQKKKSTNVRSYILQLYKKKKKKQQQTIKIHSQSYYTISSDTISNQKPPLAENNEVQQYSNSLLFASEKDYNKIKQQVNCTPIQRISENEYGSNHQAENQLVETYTKQNIQGMAQSHVVSHHNYQQAIKNQSSNPNIKKQANCEKQQKLILMTEQTHKIQERVSSLQNFTTSMYQSLFNIDAADDEVDQILSALQKQRNKCKPQKYRALPLYRYQSSNLNPFEWNEQANIIRVIEKQSTEDTETYIGPIQYQK